MSNIRYVREENSSFGTLFGAFVLSLILAIPEYLWIGFVGMTLWNWFIPGIFDGAPYISLGESIGITLVIAFFTFRRVATSNKPEKPFESVINSLVMYLIYGLLVLATGAIVHSLM